MTEIIHDYKVFDKEGFVNKLKELVRRYKVEYSIAWGTPYLEEFENPYDDFTIKVNIYPVSVTFSFEEFKIEGYTYLGCIKDHDMVGLITIHGNDLLEGHNISEWIRGFESIPCHACNRKHTRKIGHLFQKDGTSEVMVFGSGCAKKYFGVNFDRVLSFFEKLKVGFEDYFDRGFRNFITKYIDTDDLLKNVYYIIHTYGYISKSKAGYDMLVGHTASTADMVVDFRKHYQDTRKRPSDYNEVVDGVDFTDVINKDYSKDPNNLSDFEYNIQVAQKRLQEGLISSKEFGIVCWMVYNEFFKVTFEKKEFTLPEGLEAGDKIEKEIVTFMGNNSFQTDWGTTFINVFETDNVRYKWFSQVDAGYKYDIEEGDKVFINKATVKKIEDDPEYGKSVVITRPSIHNL